MKKEQKRASEKLGQEGMRRGNMGEDRRGTGRKGESKMEKAQRSEEKTKLR